MKRKIVLLFLLAFPLLLYVYFSMVKHNSLFLPTITKQVQELPQGTTPGNDSVQLKGHITILGFLGTDVLGRRENIFNINQKINAKYKGFDDFQIVMVVPAGKEQDVLEVTAKLKSMADISNWKFLFTDSLSIHKFYASLKVKEPLDNKMGTGNLFILDKKLALRGRNGKAKDGSKEYKDSYDSYIISELSNEMTDDVKILLREYRLALRRNAPKGVKREI
jgi:hypothetical protein